MRRFWIDGRFVDSASGATLEVVDPATEEVIDVVPKGGAQDVAAAVAAAKAAFPAWKGTSAWARADLLAQIACRLRQN